MLIRVFPSLDGRTGGWLLTLVLFHLKKGMSNMSLSKPIKKTEHRKTQLTTSQFLFLLPEKAEHCPLFDNLLYLIYELVEYWAAVLVNDFVTKLKKY